MRARDVIKFYIVIDGVLYDYTEGLLQCRITRGVQEYEGPFTQPDVGQMTIVSRNPNLDPYANPDVRYNTKFVVKADGYSLFTGTIDGIDVEYRPKGQDPIITLTGIDILGVMHKHVISDAFIDAWPDGITTEEMLDNLDTEVPEFYNSVKVIEGTQYVDNAAIPRGQTAWEALALRAATDLGFCYASADNSIMYYRLPANDPDHPNVNRGNSAEFFSNGTQLSYKAVRLNDGFDNIVNQMAFSNTTGTYVSGVWTEDKYEVSLEQDLSIDLWGRTRKSIELLTTNPTVVGYIADNIFEEMSYPVREIYEITVDAMVDVYAMKGIDILHNIHIRHENDYIYIDRPYSVIGMTHEITADEWRVTYRLRNWNFRDTAMNTPVVEMTPSAGNQLTEFAYSIGNFPMDEILSVLWEFDTSGTIVHTSTDLAPTYKWYTTGTKVVHLTVTNIYGWEKTVLYYHNVTGVAPLNTWTYTIDAYSVYHFTFTGDGATSYSWDFGDSTSSTAMNPTHSYGSTGNKTITLTTVGPYGTSTSSQVINTSVTTATAIRYVKIVSEVEDGIALTGDFIYGKLYYVEVKDTVGTNLALNKTYTKDLFSGKAEDSVTNSYLITNESTANWMTIQYFSVGTTNVQKAHLTIDLGATSTTIEEINLYTDNSTAAAKVYVSTNGTDWFYLGRNHLPTSMGGGVYKIGIDPVTTMPAILTGGTSTIAAAPTPLTFRYLRFTPVSSTSASADDTTWLYQIGIYRSSGGYMTNPLLPVHAGAPYKSMSYSLTSTGTYPTSYRHSGVSYYPPGAIGNRLYDLDKSTYVLWGAETTGLKFVYDFSETVTDVYKIGMEIGGAVSTEGMTIEYSLDGTTYTSLGTFYFTSLRNVYDSAHPTYWNNAADFWEIRQDPYGPIPASGWNLVQGQ